MKNIVNIINQVFEMDKKAGPSVQRHIERIRNELQEMGYTYHNPLHEKWDDTRTDCEASISGALKSKMLITEVVKPVVHQVQDGSKKIIQKAIVVVE